jgi:hypothetical protein
VNHSEEAGFPLPQAEQQTFEPVDAVEKSQDVEGGITGQMLYERR